MKESRGGGERIERGDSALAVTQLTVDRQGFELLPVRGLMIALIAPSSTDTPRSRRVSHTASTLSMVKPPENTASLRNSRCSSGVSRA